MGRYRYQLFGVCFGSDVPLELPPGRPKETPRFDIRRKAEKWLPFYPDDIVEEEGDAWTRLRVIRTGEVEMEWKGWLTFRIDPDGRRVTYEVFEQAYPTAFEAYVANFAMSACLALQGEETLHATVVNYKGLVLGLLGGSGAGKSTLTAYLVSRGAQLVTDDMLRITEEQGVSYAEAGQPRLKLLEDAAGRFFPDKANVGCWNPFSEKYLFETENPRDARTRSPLNSLLWLAPPAEFDPDVVSIERLKGFELFQTLAGSTMLSKLQTANRLARQFEFVRNVARRLPVYALRYPRRYDVFERVVELLERELV